MSRYGRIIGAALVLLPLLAGCGLWSSPPAPPVLVIGVDLDLTGRGPGVAYDNALRLALEQVNERELAGPGRRVELRMLDNRGDPVLSAQHLTALAADPEVVAVVTAGCARCVIDAAESLAVPVLALTGEEAVGAPVAQRRWVFRLGPNAADDADVLSAAMAGAGIDTVAVVHTDDPYGRDGVRWFDAAAERDELRVTATVALPAGAEALPGDVADAVLGTGRSTVDRGPDVVLLWTSPRQATDVARALRTAGYRGALYADMAAGDELFNPGPLAGGQLVATLTAVAAERVAASPAAAARQEWVLAYVSRYGTYHLASTWAADALLVVADAVARADGGDRDAVRSRIESTRIDGITGPIRFTAEQHSGLLPSALVLLSADGDRWQ
jgi:branched-chain amino acid transport system substrate-binding protein